MLGAELPSCHPAALTPDLAGIPGDPGGLGAVLCPGSEQGPVQGRQAPVTLLSHLWGQLQGHLCQACPLSGKDFFAISSPALCQFEAVPVPPCHCKKAME